MRHLNESFENERIELDGKSFHDCTFDNCELVFSGDRPPSFSDNQYIDTRFVLTGAAVRTVYLLFNIYHAGSGGREVVDNLIMDLKNRDIHGHQVSTGIPNTKDHSLV